MFEEEKTGCNLESVDDRDLLYERIAGGDTQLPDNFMIDIPWVMDQKRSDTCVGQAVAICKSVQEGMLLSVRQCWGFAKKVKAYGGWGAWIYDALKGVVQEGLNEYGWIDENVDMKRSKYMRVTVEGKDLLTSKKNAAESFWRASDWDTADKAMIENGVPLITSMDWKYKPDKKGFLYKYKEKGLGHAFIYKGWKTVNGRKARCFQNSWGKKWGDGGSFWVWEEDIAPMRMGGKYVILDIPRDKAEILSKHQGQLIKNADSPNIYFVGKKEIAWIASEEGYHFGERNGFWPNWSKVVILEQKIEEDLIF